MEADSERFVFYFWVLVGCATPLLIIALYIKRRALKKAYYAQNDDSAPVEGSLEELNAVDPNASPWLNDQRRRLLDTMEIVGRYNTFDGYSKEYVEDLLARFRAKGIACETLFQETMPLGVAAAIVAPIGTYEIFVDRDRVSDAEGVIRDFRATT